MNVYDFDEQIELYWGKYEKRISINNIFHF